MTVTNLEESQDIVRRCIDEFHIEGDAKDYQLWVVSGKEEATPYPLIGEFHISVRGPCSVYGYIWKHMQYVLGGKEVFGKDY